MSTVNTRLYFSLPFPLAEEYFNGGLAAIAQTGLHELQLVARIPVTNIDLTKNVIAHCYANPKYPDSWEISWVPEPGGTYPSFQGKLSARENERDGTTILELSGEYTPPLGAAGAAFDHVVGQRIAADMAHNLLANIAAEIKVRYAYEEARQVFEAF